MSSQDPNFPEEMPSVPPLGPPEQMEAGIGDGRGEPGLASNSDEVASPDLDPQLTPQAEPVYTSQQPPPRAAAHPSRTRQSPAPAENRWADSNKSYQPQQLGIVDQLLLLLAKGTTVWKKALHWVRSQLPADLQRKLSDEMLTAIALGLLMLGLALWNPLGAGGGERAGASEPQPAITATEPGPEGLLAQPVAAPARATEPPESPAVAPDPTPEQSLIADIQARVSRISRSYGAGLVQSVEVNLPANTLGVNLAEAWYGLPTAQQNEVAQDIYTQAQGLEFGTLQLRDPEGVVVARNPVVGPNMVVLRRLRSP
ncbi:MAG: hypothetical protein EA368_09925 [Leptolyngbya sp. DLM2.Bin27]|nr:MAG: hypothetical protein EA368_09925 [Leptolyngbya sp. DLM2.Bin27]